MDLENSNGLSSVVRKGVQHEGYWYPLTDDIRIYCENYAKIRKRMDYIKCAVMSGLAFLIGLISILLSKRISFIQLLMFVISAAIVVVSYRMIQQFQLALHRTLCSPEAEYAKTVLKDIQFEEVKTSRNKLSRKSDIRCHIILAFEDSDEEYIGATNGMKIGEQILVVKTKSIVSIESKYCFKIPCDLVLGNRQEDTIE